MADEREHRRAFRNRPLATILSQVSYALEKVGQGLRKPADAQLAGWGLEEVRAIAEETRRALGERGAVEACKDSVGSTLAELEFVVRRLEERLAGGHNGWEEGDVDVYLRQLRTQLDELADLFKEIDERYASDDIR